MTIQHSLDVDFRYATARGVRRFSVPLVAKIKPGVKSFPLYCKQDIFIFYIQWLIFLLIGNTMKNTMLRKGLTIF
ncbi:MAG: hypothetical protein WCY71_10300 [Halothiobacillaceae bacterium]